MYRRTDVHSYKPTSVHGDKGRLRLFILDRVGTPDLPDDRPRSNTRVAPAGGRVLLGMPVADLEIRRLLTCGVSVAVGVA